MKRNRTIVGVTVKITRNCVLSLLVLSLASASFATGIMPLSEVKKGMKGYGLTVFDGNKVERFDVEILGVLNNIGPRQDLILGRVSSDLVEHSGIIAGMSGSPIYIDGKVIGALAYSWQFSKDPVAGITPIEEMLRINTGGGSGGAALGQRMSNADFVSDMKNIASTDVVDKLFGGLSGKTAMTGASALPIAVPLSFGSFSTDTLQRYGKYLEASGFMAVPSGTTATGSASSTTNSKTPFAPGDAIAGVLVDGDFSVAATGTVTYVDGDRVWAFGHPFMDLGQISFPMARSEVVAIMANVARSFKFANSGQIVGSLQQDRSVGIMGVVGHEPEMIPIELTVDGVKGTETYHLRVIRHPQLSPLMLAMAADNIVSSTQRAAGERTVILDSEIDVDGYPPIHLQDGWAGSQARQAIPNYLAVVSSYLLSNEFRNATIRNVKIHLRHDDELKIARLEQASIDTPADGQIHAGDTIRLRTTLKPFRGEAFEKTFDVRIPDDQKPGTAYLFVGSGSAMSQLDFLLVPPVPNSLDQVVKTVRRLRSSTDLTVGLYSASQGAVTSGVYLPNLPPSVNAVVNGDSSNSAQVPVGYYAPEHLVTPLQYVVDGSLKLDLQISPRM
ncbi:MAG: SpoIVB peptidase S55 domain-containing protein [Acidobacteriota bacterium]